MELAPEDQFLFIDSIAKIPFHGKPEDRVLYQEKLQNVLESKENREKFLRFAMSIYQDILIHEHERNTCS